jgi:hypothetical protein
VDENPKPHIVDNGEPKPPQEVAPFCPNCKMDPVMPMARTFNIGPFTVLLTFCGRCRYPIPATLIAVAQPQIARPKLIV